MRSNGLTAPSYTPVADLEPDVADVVLAELKQERVAAYTRPADEPSASGVDPRERTGLDRLYVDAVQAERVRALLAARPAGVAEASDDLAWAQIVAGYDHPVSDDAARWPAYEDVDPGHDDVPDADRDDERPPRDLRSWLARRDATGPPAPDDVDLRDRDDDPDDEVAEIDRFVPAAPPPLPRLEPYQQLAWVGVLGGPILLLAGVLLSLALPSWISVLAVAGFIGGFVTLVATMKDRDDDGDTGNGAVV